MKVNRLITLAKHLRAIEDKVPEDTGRGAKARGFDLRTWVRSPRARGSSTLDFKSRPCGTAACAFGEATFITEFRALGLRRESGVPKFGGSYGMGAAARFFGISIDDAVHLFDSLAYPVSATEISPAVVADRIAELVTRL